jgi:hypothetical protein
MCCHHRSRYGGYGHHGYGHPHHHRGGPISALVALAVPLLTQNTRSSEKPALTHDPYQPTTTREYLAPQTTGRTVAPTPTWAPSNPAATEPNGPPPAYEDTRPSAGELEKSMAGMYVSEPPPPAAVSPAVGARGYQPTARHMSGGDNAMPFSGPAQADSPRDLVGGIFDPSSRWAARLHRKEDKERAKLARKAEKYARRERREVERGY